LKTFGFLILFFSLSLPAKQIEKLSEVPQPVIKFCHDRFGKIADNGQPWNMTDDGFSTLPQSIFIKACSDSEFSWSLLCRKGGFATSYHLVRIVKNATNWQKISEVQSPQPPKLVCH
jgi:hypothetical protein